MIKRIALITKKPGMTDKDFREYWLNTHGELVKLLPNVKSYTQNHIVDAAQRFDSPKGALKVDGIVEFLFEDEEKMEQAFASAAGKALVEDAHKFLGTVTTYLVQEHRIIDN